MHAIVYIVRIVAFATVAMTIPSDTGTFTTQNTQNIESYLNPDIQNIYNVVRRSSCNTDADGVMPLDCSQVNSALRAVLAILCLLVFLVLVHFWQAIQFNKIRKSFSFLFACSR